MLAGSAAVVVAFDAGERAVALRRQVPAARTAGLIVRRTAWRTAACAVAAAVAVLASLIPTTAEPGGAALALLGGVLVALALRS